MSNNSRLSFTSPSELMHSALNSLAALSSQNPSPQNPAHPTNTTSTHSKQDLLWATKLDLKEKGYQCLHDFTLLAKEATYVTETSEEVMKCAKQFTSVEPSIKNTHQTLLKIKQSMSGIHQCNESILDSFKTLPHLLDSLQIEELAKLTPNSAPSAFSQATLSPQSNLQPYSNFHYSLSQLSPSPNYHSDDYNKGVGYRYQLYEDDIEEDDNLNFEFKPTQFQPPQVEYNKSVPNAEATLKNVTNWVFVNVSQLIHPERQSSGRESTRKFFGQLVQERPPVATITFAEGIKNYLYFLNSDNSIVLNLIDMESLNFRFDTPQELQFIQWSSWFQREYQLKRVIGIDSLADIHYVRSNLELDSFGEKNELLPKRVFSLHSAKVTLETIHHYSNIPLLDSPNLITGSMASLFTQLQVNNHSGTLLIILSSAESDLNTNLNHIHTHFQKEFGNGLDFNWFIQLLNQHINQLDTHRSKLNQLYV